MYKIEDKFPQTIIPTSYGEERQAETAVIKEIIAKYYSLKQDFEWKCFLLMVNKASYPCSLF